MHLPGNELWVWSPIRLTDDLREGVQNLGTVRYLVAPNKLHHLFLGDWTKTFPGASLYGPESLIEKRQDLSFTAPLQTDPFADWSAIDQIIVEGSFLLEEILFYHRPSKSILVTDLIQRHSPSLLSGWRGWLMKLDGIGGHQGSTPREWRWTFWNRRRARECVRRALAWEIQNLIVAHGLCEFGSGKAVFREALSWLIEGA